MEATEDEMVEQHHQLNGHDFQQTLGNSEGQGSLMCCSPWGHKELDTTQWLNNNNKSKKVQRQAMRIKDRTFKYANFKNTHVGQLGSLNGQVLTAICKMDNQQGPTV